MRREDLRELHCIMPIENMPSVMRVGILPHQQARRVAHDSVANQDVQERRARVRVRGGRPLHEYANLYFSARNPMMYAMREDHASLCVVSVSTDVLDVDGTVVTDKNAAADYVRFESSPAGLAIVDKDLTFATFWTANDYYEQIRRKQAKQAELLVPDAVPVDLIRVAYVSCTAAENQLNKVASECECRIRPNLFFQSPQ